MDYLKNDLVSIKDNGFKDVDSIVCSLLTTLKYNIANNTSIKDLYNDYSEDYFIKLLASNNRYKNMIIKNYIKDHSNGIQFGVVNVQIDGLNIITFQGTDGTIMSWEENFKIGYEYPTKTQILAIDYLNNNVDSDTIIVGHSKGGNLALVASLECKKKRYIKKIYNLDGPGFDSVRYVKADKMKKKIITYLPVNSFVGALLKNYNVECIKSNGMGFAEHNVANWNLEDYSLVRDELSENSIKANKMSCYALDNFNKEDARKIVELFFSILRKNNIKTKKDYGNIDVSSIFEELEKLDIDENVKKYYVSMFKVMLS